VPRSRRSRIKGDDRRQPRDRAAPRAGNGRNEGSWSHTFPNRSCSSRPTSTAARSRRRPRRKHRSYLNLVDTIDRRLDVERIVGAPTRATTGGSGPTSEADGRTRELTRETGRLASVIK
jgi:hypothetical protein